MLNKKSRTVLRLVMGIVFVALGIKNIVETEYIWAAVTLVAGLAFIISLFLKSKGDKE